MHSEILNMSELSIEGGSFPSKPLTHVNCNEVGYTPDDSETVLKSLKPLCFALLVALAWQLKMHSGMQCTIFPVAFKANAENWRKQMEERKLQTYLTRIKVKCISM